MKTYQFKIGNNPYQVDILSVEGGIAKVSVNGIEYEVEMENAPAASPVQAPAAAPAPAVQAPAAPAAAPVAAPAGNAKKVTSPLPGVILSVNVSVGTPVESGDVLATMN